LWIKTDDKAAEFIATESTKGAKKGRTAKSSLCDVWPLWIVRRWCFEAAHSDRSWRTISVLSDFVRQHLPSFKRVHSTLARALLVGSVGQRNFMSVNVISLVLGIAVGLLWTRGLVRGVMLGLVFGLVRQAETPVRFFACSAVYGAIACGLIAVPVLAWMGLRG
jgi:hypothetical protein